jgi:Zn-finger nucleic acid-binding protein
VFLAHATLATQIDAERPARKPPRPPRHASQAPRESEVHYAWCPECRQTMARMNFGGHSGIVVDVCRAHGTWFDRGELEAALDFVRAGGVEEDLATAHPADEAAGAEANRLERRLEVTLQAETMAEVRAAEDLIWATGNLMVSLAAGGHGPYYLRRLRNPPR